MSKDKSCPCHHLDEPCTPRCTCIDSLSSSGCLNCCTYGSKEQQKAQAEYLNQLRINYENMNISLMGSKSTFLVDIGDVNYMVDIIGSELDDYAVVSIKYVENNLDIGKGIIYDTILNGIKNREINGKK